MGIVAGVLVDVTSNANHGVPRDGVTLAKGRLGNALRFDGVDGSVEVLDPNDDYSFAGTAVFTVEFIANITSLPNVFPRVLDKQFTDVNGEQGWRIILSQSANTISFSRFRDGVGDSVTAGITLNTSARWSAVYDGADMILYEEGVEKARTASSLLMLANAEPLIIGNISVGATSRAYHGTLDDIRFFDDVRSPTEIDDNKNVELGSTQANMVGSWRATYGDQPATHARIGHATITRTGTLSASGEQVGFEADSALNALTYEFWKADALPATWRIDAGAAVEVDYVGIAAHTLGTDAAAVQVQFSDDDSAWTDASEAHTPTDDAPVMFLLDSGLSYRYWRIRVTGSTIPSIGVVYIGKALAMQRAIYGGHSPLALARRTVIRPQQSERGQWLGRSIIRSGSMTEFSWQHLTPAWYRTNFDPFVEDARSFPFFLAWRPSAYDEAGYVWTHSDIAPSNMGTGKGLMQVSMSVEGLGIE